MGFADDVKSTAGTLGDKAKGAFEAARDKAEELIEEVKDKISGDDGDTSTNAGSAVEPTADAPPATDFYDTAPASADPSANPAVDDAVGSADVPLDEPVEDFAAAGPAVPSYDDKPDAIDEEADELQRQSQPGQL